MARRPPVYVALIGDIVASRSLAPGQRKQLQSCLRRWLKELNAEFDEELAAPLTLTAGDEIQCLFRKPAALMPVVQSLTDWMFRLQYKPRVLFGAGRGALFTGGIPPPPVNPALLDGPVFHFARRALEEVQDNGGWVRFVGFDEDEVPKGVTTVVLDALFGFMGSLRDNWTDKQGRYSYLMRSRTGVSQKALAEEFKVSPSVISETLKASRHALLMEGEEAARLLLETFDSDPG